MNVASKWSPSANLFNFMATADDVENGKSGWVYAMFAQGLFIAAKDLRTTAPLEQVKLEAARFAVKWLKLKALAGWSAKGCPVQWTDDDYEAIAREMADELPRHPRVVASIESMLREYRDEAFSDLSLTMNDEMFVVWKVKRNTSLFENHNQEISEPPMVTINRSLDYLTDLSKTEAVIPFIPLKRILTILARVHDVVVAH